MKTLAVAAIAALWASTVSVQPALRPELSGLRFLTGKWLSGRRTVAETGGVSTGYSDFEPILGGSALLRRDHTYLSDAAGKPTGSFDQLTTIYPEAGGIHADYVDGTHVIHYTSAFAVSSRSVTFITQTSSAAPQFKLAYSLAGPDTLSRLLDGASRQWEVSPHRLGHAGEESLAMLVR